MHQVVQSSYLPVNQLLDVYKRQVGVKDEALAERFSRDFFAIIPTKSVLMPHAKEVLEYLCLLYTSPTSFADCFRIQLAIPEKPSFFR